MRKSIISLYSTTHPPPALIRREGDEIPIRFYLIILFPALPLKGLEEVSLVPGSNAVIGLRKERTEVESGREKLYRGSRIG